MSAVREWLQRLRATVSPDRRDDDLEEELRLHLESVAEEARRRGRDPDKAVRRARLEAGGPAPTMEALRDQRGLPWVEDLGRDVRYGFRVLRRSPAFAVVAIVTLALGFCPPSLPALDVAEFSAASLPARSIGGDYYDFVEIGDRRIGIALADVSGKGIAAALIMSVVQASLRMLAADGDMSLPQLAARMNDFLYKTTPGNKYATFFYAQLDAESRQLRYVNAGHNPPMLVRGADARGGDEPRYLRVRYTLCHAKAARRRISIGRCGIPSPAGATFGSVSVPCGCSGSRARGDADADVSVVVEQLTDTVRAQAIALAFQAWRNPEGRGPLISALPWNAAEQEARRKSERRIALDSDVRACRCDRRQSHGERARRGRAGRRRPAAAKALLEFGLHNDAVSRAHSVPSDDVRDVGGRGILIAGAQSAASQITFGTRLGFRRTNGDMVTLGQQRHVGSVCSSAFATGDLVERRQAAITRPSAAEPTARTSSSTMFSTKGSPSSAWYTNHSCGSQNMPKITAPQHTPFHGHVPPGIAGANRA